jgi:hypothetical protein
MHMEGGIMSLTGETDRKPLVTGDEPAYALGGANALWVVEGAHNTAVFQLVKGLAVEC